MAIHLLFFQTVLLFLSGSNCLLLKAHLCSCPLLGNLLSLQIINVNKSVELDEFSSPIGESIFSTILGTAAADKEIHSSRPLSGNLFSLRALVMSNEVKEACSRPLSGNLFSLQSVIRTFRPLAMEFSSPIGESIFSTHQPSILQSSVTSVLVPYRGIYFLYMNKKLGAENLKWFSSPIGESIFSTKRPRNEKVYCILFSSPIGESIFSTIIQNGGTEK